MEFSDTPVKPLENLSAVTCRTLILLKNAAMVEKYRPTTVSEGVLFVATNFIGFQYRS